MTRTHARSRAIRASRDTDSKREDAQTQGAIQEETHRINKLKSELQRVFDVLASVDDTPGALTYHREDNAKRSCPTATRRARTCMRCTASVDCAKDAFWRIQETRKLLSNSTQTTNRHHVRQRRG